MKEVSAALFKSENEFEELYNTSMLLKKIFRLDMVTIVGYKTISTYKHVNNMNI